MIKALILIFIPLLTIASSLQEGLNFYNQDNYDQALIKLREVAPATLGFKKSLEIQSFIYYKQEDLSKLLVTALFYRKHFIQDKEFNPKVLGLELLTLTKMCQFEAVTEILTYVKKNTKLDTNELEKNLEITQKFSITYNLAPIDKYTKRDLWKINDKQILELKTPYNLVLRLENKCKG